MKKEKNNFARAVEWLIENKKVKEQKDIAKMMKVTPATISRLKNGFVKNPDPDTIRKFDEQFGEYINIAYIRYESDVMLVTELPSVPAASASADPTAAALLAAKDEIIAGLKRELAGKDSRLADKDTIIAAKDALIANLQQQIDELHLRVMEKGRLKDGFPHSESHERQSRPT